MTRRGLSALAALALLFLLGGCAGLTDLTDRLLSPDPPPADYTAQEDGFRYLKSCLPPQTQYIYDQLLAGIQEQAEEIDDLYPDAEMIRAAAQALGRDYPELFWFSGSGEIETTYLGDTATTAVYRPVYVVSAQERPGLQAQIDQWAADCFATLPENASDYDKVLGVYRYIIEHADYQAVESNSILNIMVHGAGLCGCYAQTTQYLLTQLGIPCTYISGQAHGESHAWNLIWLDGNPCWLDTTWGDPVFEGGSANDGPSYDYFCITTRDLLRTHSIDGTVPVPDCTCEDYNYYRCHGLYFESYQPDALANTIQQAVDRGDTQLSLRFSTGAYWNACDHLFTQGELHDLFHQTPAGQAEQLDWRGQLWYTRNDDMGTLTLTIPYR